jgi:quinol monooxygenase YgiN
MESIRTADSAIQCIFSLKATPANAEQLLKALSKVILQSRAEVGCIRSNLHVSLTDYTAFFVHETWQDEQALDAHTSSRAFQNFLKSTKPLLEKPLDVNVIRQVS